MSTDNVQSNDDNTAELQQDELSVLKARADMLGLTYHPSIGIEKLREKIAQSLAASEPAKTLEEAKPADAAVSQAGSVTSAADPVVDPGVASDANAPVAVEESAIAKRSRLRREATKLIRIRVTNMNPAKKDWEGEIITTGNNAVGTLKKYVPFNAEEGWHVPYMIYQVLKARECQVFTTEKSKFGVAVRKSKLIKEFAIEVLDPLTKGELEELARRQAMSGSVD